MAQEFTSAAVPKYHLIQEKQIRLLVQNLVKHPNMFDQELELCDSFPSSQVKFDLFM